MTNKKKNRTDKRLTLSFGNRKDNGNSAESTEKNRSVIITFNLNNGDISITEKDSISGEEKVRTVVCPAARSNSIATSREQDLVFLENNRKSLYFPV